MKIAVNTRLLLHDKLSGIGWFKYHVLKRMVEQHPNDEFVFLFDRQYDERFIFGPNVIPEVVFPQARHPFLYYIWFNYSIVPVINKHKADVFLSPDGLLSTRLPFIPSVPVIHDINFQHYPKDIPYFMRHYYCHYFPIYAKIAKRIITVSEFSKKDIVKTYGADADLIDVAYNGAGEDFKPLDEYQKHEVRNQFANGAEYFVYVGNLLPRKNVDGMIKAFTLCKNKTGLSTKLVIVGESFFMTDKIKEAYDNSNVKDDIIFTGRLTQEELPLVVGAAKGLIFVSHFEGFGIPILEAMQCDVPVITSNTSSMPEVAGDAAILADPNNIGQIAQAIEDIDTKNNLRNELIEKSRIRRQAFNWDKTAEEVWKSLTKAVF
ncbi:MAG TPA: glycosyltransferase family 1 protein [Bacteroidales bacterium]|nr:glycosyltransferase family 1 protein [Bacteroidales bacterium]